MIIIENKNNPKKLNPILNEIKLLREEKDFLIDKRNTNRYRVIVKETLGHTAYCFSTPIYNLSTRKLVNPTFEESNNGYYFKGSNGSISICKTRCVFENHDGRVIITLKKEPKVRGGDDINSDITITPTLNGILFTVKGKHLNFLVKSETKEDHIRFNSTCFSIMREKFKPFLSIAMLYATDTKGNFSPVKMNYQDNEDRTYEFDIFNDIENGVFLFEVNLYEAKLFQDTTVRSIHPNANNAYGAIGFIGKTKQFGEEWLYSRPDFCKIPDLTSERVDRVLLHIPILNDSLENVDVFVPQKRFCSFGATWNKKVTSSGKVASSNNNGRYITIDVTTMFTNRTEHTLVYNEGLIVKKPKGKNDFIAISTGDCYYAPQILEIKFK